MSTETTTGPKAKKARSPAYPGIDLSTAIAKAQLVFDREGQHQAHVDTLYGHWGNKPGSGAGAMVMSALVKFGLLADEGSGDSRRARLTPSALTILLEPSDSPARTAEIKSAALRPRIHQEVWEKYGGSLPSDQNLRLWLIRDRGFTSNGATDFISELRRTVTFAELGPFDTLLAQEASPAEEAPQGMSATATRSPAPTAEPVYRPTAPQTSRVIQLPLGSEWATLAAPFPLTEEAWRLMLAVLNAMKPGLVKNTGKEDKPDGEASD